LTEALAPWLFIRYDKRITASRFGFVCVAGLALLNFGE
jgi:hypothetical protein